MAVDEVEEVAALISARNAIDDRIAGIIKRPAVSGHLAEWLAARIFDIELEPSATAAAVDGRFTSGPLAGKTVNIKWYLKREGLLDLTEADTLDYYLVLAGPTAAAASSSNTTRPWCVNAVYLFGAPQLLTEQRERNVKLGVASSVTNAQWRRAEISPSPDPVFPLTPAQADLLALFHGDRSRSG
jgi:hypothetical protein